MSARKFKPANENPWYILMTLHGEQGIGPEFDPKLYQLNRWLWNAWTCQALSNQERIEAAKMSDIDFKETQWNAQIARVVRTRFIAEYKRRNKSNKVPNLPDPNAPIDLSEVTFANGIMLAQVIFGSEVSFAKATFRRRAEFHGSTFMKEASFSGTTFEQEGSFHRTHFEMHATFSDATFTEPADFINATFKQIASFGNAIFNHRAHFSVATFTLQAYFDGAIFKRTAFFSRATFRDYAQFRFAGFEDHAEFGGTEFEVSTKFREAIDFSSCQMKGPATFEEAVFRSQLPKLTNAILPQTTKVSAAKGNWPDVPEKWSWLTNRVTKTWEFPEQIKASAATLRHAMGRQNLPEDEHFFFRYEMHAASLIGGFWQRLPYGLFGLVSDFGNSILRPVLCLIGIVSFFAILYWLQLAAVMAMEGVHKTPFEALALSFSNTFSFFGFQRLYFGAKYMNDLHWWMRVAGAFQTIAGFILLFFLGLGLRTRFRLR